MYTKRVVDFFAAFTGMALTLPLFVLLVPMLAIANKGAPFFLQKRVGKNNRVFTILKFKTMTDAKDDHGRLLPDEKRLTTLGRFVRKTSLDELPQLLNVIKGDMSLVGPRPLLVVYLPLYSKEQARRHEVRPGITGWTQVNGRNALSWKQKFEFDVWYVDNLGFWLDLKILWRTVAKVFKREGITAPDGGFTEPFRGREN